MITSQQMRAARALLGIDQKELAALAGVSLPTIQRMEASDGQVRGVVETLVRVISALERGGVELIGENAPSQGRGRGVRLREVASFATRMDKDKRMMQDSDDYIYDEASGEWMSAADLAHRNVPAGEVEVRDAVGNLLTDGDSVTLIKDLTVKGANQTLKRGTVIKSIRLTGDAQKIDCRYDGIKGLVLRAEFVRKR
jgi:protein PhnA